MEPLILQSKECQLGAAAVLQAGTPGARLRLALQKDRLQLTAIFQTEQHKTLNDCLNCSERKNINRSQICVFVRKLKMYAMVTGLRSDIENIIVYSILKLCYS